MTDFIYIDSNTLMLDSFKLGKKIYQSGFIPTHAISLWRGGTPIGLGVGEFFRLKGHLIQHTTIATASYTGINSQNEVIIKGLEHLIEVISREDKLLIIDDVYDSGRTITTIVKAIEQRARANTPKEIRIACVHNKIKNHSYLCETISLNEITDDNKWLSYPHEISDLVFDDDPNELILQEKSKPIYKIISREERYEHQKIENGERIYITPNELLEDSLKLANIIFSSGYIPDFLIAIWPRGVNVGLPVHEYFKYKIKKNKMNIAPPDHISINTTNSASSYKSNIIGIKYLEDNINSNDKILLIDSVFNTGRLINDTIDKLRGILKRNIDIENIKVATLYYKPNSDVTWTKMPTFKAPHFFLKETESEIVLPEEIHKLLNPEVELINLNLELKRIIFE